MESTILQVSALGRPFRLGMLYDARTDSAVPCETLWNQSTLQSAVLKTPQQGTKLSIDASDTIESKANFLDVSVGLKLSFLGGLVKVSGSAAYLDDRKCSDHVERVSLKYKATTWLHQLGMEVLGTPEYLSVFDKNIATHVVTAILYGGQAVFVFDRSVSSNESRREVKGNLQIMVNSIPGVEIGGEGSLRLTEDQQKEANSFKCNFHGDFMPSQNPTTFNDAVKINKELPSLLGLNGENAVPVEVWLYPLELLDNKAKRILREISSSLVDHVETVFEEIQSLIIRANDLADHDSSQKFGLLRKKVDIVKRYVVSYKTMFQKNLMPLLPQIRGGDKAESALVDVFTERDRSPFNYNDLDEWLTLRGTQAEVLTKFTAMMEDVYFARDPGDIHKVVLDPKYKYVVMFVFLVNYEEDPYLQMLKKYIYGEPTGLVDGARSFKLTENWYSDESITQRMIENVRRFAGFAAANAGNESVMFVGAEKKCHRGIQ